MFLDILISDSWGLTEAITIALKILDNRDRHRDAETYRQAPARSEGERPTVIVRRMYLPRRFEYGNKVAKLGDDVMVHRDCQENHVHRVH